MTRVRFKRAQGLALALALAFPIAINRAEAQDQTEGALPICDRDLAILRVERQVSDSSGIDDPVSRIAVLIRAADLLWPHRQDTARETFTRAYDVAEKHFQEKGDENRREGRLKIGLEDQRFVVMAAIARRDAAWAQRLAERHRGGDQAGSRERRCFDGQSRWRRGESARHGSIVAPC